MSWWSRTCVVLLSALYLQQFIRVTCAQRFQLEVLLTRYEGGSNTNQVFLRACVREATASACDNDCTMEESQDTTLTHLFSPPISLTFGIDTLGSSHQMCVDIWRNLNDPNPLVSFSSPVITTTMTGEPVEEVFRRDGGGTNNRVDIDYTYQVVCAGNYFGPSCSTSCTQTEGSSVSFRCVGANGEVLTCQPVDPNCNECIPDLNNCQLIETAPTPTGPSTTAISSETVPTSQSTTGSSHTVISSEATTTGQISMPTTASSATDDNSATMQSVTRNDAKETTTSSVSITVGNGAEGSNTGASQGQVAGIVVSLLILAVLVVAGAVAGVLAWKYQPWHNILRKKDKDDAIENPVYDEMELRGSNPQSNGHELTASTFSSPLYSEDASRDNGYTENGNLMDIIRLQSAKKKGKIIQELPGKEVPVTATVAELSNGAAAVSKTDTARSVDIYRESVTFGGGDSGVGDSQVVYEPVDAAPSSQPTFDNPDYEAV